MSIGSVLIVFVLLCLVAAVAVKKWESYERKKDEEGR